MGVPGKICGFFTSKNLGYDRKYNKDTKRDTCNDKRYLHGGGKGVHGKYRHNRLMAVII